MWKNVFWVAAFVLAFAAGCGSRGPRLARVQGKVTMDGEPLANVIVTFTPEGGGIASSGITNEKGEYELACPQGKGAVVGRHKVSVRSQPPKQTTAAAQVSSDDPSYQYGGQDSATAPKFVEKVPPRYNTNTELVMEVKPGTNVINLPLTSK